jgi:ABC-type spermidine/putrescine transport system permease subunit II
MDKDPIHKPLYKSLYFQVITAIVIGVLLGHFYPETGVAMKPFGDGFIKLIKMIIAPIIFCTVVVGIAGMEDMKKVGKTGGLALLYFEVVSGVALVVGLVTPTLAVLAAMAVRELRIPRVVLLLTLLPLFIPGVSMGLATAFLFERVGLEPSLLSIYIVNVLWALPFAFLVVLTTMSNFDTVQLEAAWILGSNRWRAFWDVEFPSIRPGVVGAATFSMILSFNETARTSLVQGANNTVQTYIWSTYKQVGLSPTLYALMTLLILVTLVLVLGFWSASGAHTRPSIG